MGLRGECQAISARTSHFLTDQLKIAILQAWPQSLLRGSCLFCFQKEVKGVKYPVIDPLRD